MSLNPPYIWLVEPAQTSSAPYPNGCTSAEDLLQCTQPTGHWSWVDYSMNLAAKYKLIIEVSQGQTEWKCYPGIDVPLRVNSGGDVECMSMDNANCLWSDNCAAVLSAYSSATLNPLSCGQEHRNVWGGPGYDTPAHWCYKGWELIKPWLCIPPFTTPLRLNPLGNPECLANNGADCYWGTVSCTSITTVTPSIPASQIIPLVCGIGHLNMHGITGYTDPVHWCYQTIKTLEPNCISNNAVSFCSGPTCTGTTPCPVLNS